MGRGPIWEAVEEEAVEEDDEAAGARVGRKETSTGLLSQSAWLFFKRERSCRLSRHLL